MTGHKWDISGHELDMSTFEEFERCVRGALAHLYDPAYRAPELLWAVMGCEPDQGIESIQTDLVRAIEDLRPAPDVPPTARSRRIYGLLSYGYVQDLTQEDTAERLGISPRHLRRERQEAVHVLALRLWEKGRAQVLLPGDLAQEEAAHPPAATPPGAKTRQWRSQVRQELASLQEGAPGAVAGVAETIWDAAELGRALTSRRGVRLEVERVEPDMVAAIHPSALREILIAAIRGVGQCMSSGRIALGAEGEKGRVEITISGHPVEADSAPNGDLIREILAMQGGSLDVGLDGDHISFRVELPSVDQAVLVVDDNTDLVHVYRRYVLGTRYRIIHAPQAQRLFETIESSVPDIIVLDIMLPDVDGWKLLVQLHEQPATRRVPVIVCSVVREEELALALGAALYLPKPVERQQFIQALDHVLRRASRAAPRVQANSATTC